MQAIQFKQKHFLMQPKTLKVTIKDMKDKHFTDDCFPSEKMSLQLRLLLATPFSQNSFSQLFLQLSAICSSKAGF